MPVLLQEAVGAFVRFALMALAGYVVKAGIWNESEATTYVVAGTVAILTFGWSMWNKYKRRILLLVALEEPAGTTEAEAAAKAKAVQGTSAAPTVMSFILMLVVTASGVACASGGRTPQRNVALYGITVVEQLGNVQVTGRGLYDAKVITPEQYKVLLGKLKIANEQAIKLADALDVYNVATAGPDQAGAAATARAALIALQALVPQLPAGLGTAGDKITQIVNETMKIIEAIRLDFQQKQPTPAPSGYMFSRELTYLAA